MLTDRIRQKLRIPAALLLLAAFGYCAANAFQQRDDNGGSDLASLLPDLPDLLSSVSSPPPLSPPTADEILSSGQALPPPPPPERQIIVDPGHGGMDGGTQGNGLLEKEWTLKIAHELTRELRERGFKVAMTREGDERLKLSDRSNFSNSQENHLLVSVHLNQCANPSVSGIETFYRERRTLSAMNGVRQEFAASSGAPIEDQRSELLAEAVQSHLIEMTAANDRGIKGDQELFVLEHTIAPSVLVECGFVSSAEEAALITKSSYRKRLARGIANGITAFMNEVETDPMYGVQIKPAVIDLPDTPERLDELVSSNP